MLRTLTPAQINKTIATTGLSTTDAHRTDVCITHTTKNDTTIATPGLLRLMTIIRVRQAIQRINERIAEELRREAGFITRVMERWKEM